MTITHHTTHVTNYRQGDSMNYEWIDDAVCAHTDDDWWLAERGDYPARNKARTLCEECPAKWECLDAALEHDRRELSRHRTFGIWGGTDEEEREQLIGMKLARRDDAAGRLSAWQKERTYAVIDHLRVGDGLHETAAAFRISGESLLRWLHRNDAAHLARRLEWNTRRRNGATS